VKIYCVNHYERYFIRCLITWRSNLRGCGPPADISRPAACAAAGEENRLGDINAGPRSGVRARRFLATAVAAATADADKFSPGGGVGGGGISNWAG
jgi:hypothetical protein